MRLFSRPERRSHESDARRLPTILAIRPLAPRYALRDRRDLPARLARAAPSRSLALEGGGALRVFRRLSCPLSGAGFTDRAVRRALSANPHGAARVAHDGRAAALVAGQSVLPFAPRIAAVDPRRLGRPDFSIASRPSILHVALPSQGGAASACCRQLGMASPGGVRIGPALIGLALRATRVFPGDGTLVLVPGRPPLSQPAQMDALAAVSLPDFGRCPEHRPLGPPDVFRPPVVPVLRGSPANRWPFSPGGSIRRGRHHVGAGLVGLPGAALRNRHSASDRRREGHTEAHRAEALANNPQPIAGSSDPPNFGTGATHGTWIHFVRCFAHPWVGSLSALAARKDDSPDSADAARRRHHLRRTLRPTRRGDEPCRRAALDSLARSGRDWDAGGGQRLLHGVSVYVASGPGSTLACGHTRVADLAPQQMAVGSVAGHFFVGVRGLRPLGQPLGHGLDRAGLFCGRLCGRQFFSRRVVLQICLPDRTVQLRAVADLAAGNQGARAGSLHLVQNQGLHSRQRDESRMRAAPVPTSQIEQHGLHRLPRLPPCLPPRQHRHPWRAARSRAVERSVPLGRRTLREAARPGRPVRSPDVRRFRQCRRNDRPVGGLAEPNQFGLRFAVTFGRNHRVLFCRFDRDSAAVCRKRRPS